MSSEVQLPVFFSQDDASQSCPPDWAAVRVEDAISLIKQGPRWEKKSVQEFGSVKVLDQSKDGVIGFHDSEPGVSASQQDPVVTFANHTCNIRILRENFSTIQNVFAFRGRDQISDTRFLYYWLQGRVATEEYKGFFPTLRSQWLPLPPLDEQRRIAGVLGALDDLIEVNRGLIRDIDAFFHATWCQSFSHIAGTGNTKLADLCSTQYGFTDAATDDPVGPKFLRVADINKQNWINWQTVPHCSSDARKNDKYKLNKGDLVVARMADPGQSARIDSDVDAVFASYLVRLKLHNPDLGLFLYGFLKSSLYRDYSLSAMTGSVQKNMNARVITNVTVGVPDQDALDKFNRATGPLRDAIVSLQAEIAELEATRDELLPLLLSGRVRVGDVAA